MHKINISFEEEPDKVMNLKAGAGQILLHTLLDNKIAIRHDCGGICACATCHVCVIGDTAALESPNRREVHFLKKAVDVKPNSRLACQCIFTTGNAALQLVIPNQNAIPSTANRFTV